MKLVVILRYEVLVLAAVALWGCGEATCPAGSEEVGGKCKKMGAAEHGDKDAMTPEASEGGGDADAGGLRDATAAPMEHADAAANGEDEPDAARHDDGGSDAGGSDDGGSDAGGSDAGGSDDAGSDGAMPEPSCEPGFVLDDSQCVRDRCLATDEEAAACGEHGQCSDGTRDEPSCACDEGYVDEDAQCVRNPCIALDGEPAACDPNAECSYEGEGEASCECNEGYDGDGATCERNACIRLSGEDPPCGANQVCMPTSPGEKSCECAEQFADCDGELDTGCEINLSNNPENCGECEYACASGLECSDSECAQRVAEIAAGPNQTCGLTPEREVLCWGAGTILHGHDVTSSNIPVSIDVGPANSIAVGSAAACALGDANSVTCWGSSNAQYQLAGTDTAASIQTITVASARSVDVEGTYGCVVNDPGQVFCWGDTNYGHMGDGIAYNAQQRYKPYSERRPVLSVTGALEVSTGDRIACARTGGGGVRCWGAEFSVSTPEIYDPTEIKVETAGRPVIDRAVSVCTGSYHGCALLNDATVVCWGNNMFGQYGNGTIQTLAAQIDFDGIAKVVQNSLATGPLEDVVQIACGVGHNCARTSSGELYCWGYNQSGQLGLPASDPVLFPHRVAGITDTVDLAAGGSHTCASTRDGGVYCWGTDTDGELGIGVTQATPISTPTELTYWP